MPPSLLFLHGFPLDAGLWEPQTTHFMQRHQVLAPDLRGFGNDARPVPEAMTMEAYADDMRRVLDDAGVEHVVLCGLSMGGYVALAFIEQWPERVAGLILCNTRSTADTEEARAAREQTALDAHAHGAATIARAMAPKVVSARTRSEQPWVVERLREMMQRQRPEAIAAASRGMALRPDRTAMLQRIRVPTLIITGSDDGLMPMPTSEAMHAAIPDCRLEMIDGAGHISSMEQPQAFNAAVQRYLDEL